MIRTVGQFLEAILDRKKRNFPDFSSIQHAGMYGDMFEGLTQDILRRAIFDRLDLRVVKGKIRNDSAKLSRQLDCMVVIGEGEQIPYTDHYIYPFDKVIMVVEVKKTLYASELQDAIALFRQLWDMTNNQGTIKVGLLQDAWRGLFEQNLPSDNEVPFMPFHEQMIYKTLAVEAVLPVRVIFGFEGYTSEDSIRQGVIRHFRSMGNIPLQNRPKFNINAFPNLIICGKASIVKLDGYPYTGHMLSESFWCWLASKSQAPINVLLEMLWTRLAYIFNLSPSIFGPDLDIERATPLCSAKAIMKQDQGGWALRSIVRPKKELGSDKEFDDWHPPTIDKCEFVVLERLFSAGEIALSDKHLLEYLRAEGLTIDKMASSLKEKKLATSKNGKLVPLTDKCQVMTLPDGRIVAAENKSGRLTNYAMRALTKYRKEHQQ